MEILPMKLMIASDIHGSAHFCQQLVDCFVAENPTKLLLLGDLLYHGPRNPLPQGYNPQAVAQMLNDIEQKVIWTKGNCDADIDQMLLQFTACDNCLLHVDGKTIFAQHGHVFCKQNPPMLNQGEILLNGHFHVPTAESFGNDNLYVNCGSVSIPKENSPHCYLILENGVFSWKTLDGLVFKTHTL